MKKVMLAVTGFALAATLALPGSAVGQALAGDSVVGSGEALQSDFTVFIQAGPNGENPTGSLTLTGFLDFTATPTCLKVSSNAAVVGFPVPGNAAVVGFRIDSGPQTGQGFLASFADFGPPVNGQPADIVRYAGGLLTPPTTCPEPRDSPPLELLNPGGGPLTSGDLTVTDAQPRPTSKEQCKNGGWRNFPGFKSQGECVSFVATGGQHPPAGS